MDRSYVKTNIIRISVAAFVVIYLALISCRSSYLYTDEGSLREFGIGKSGKTVLPAWLAAVLLAIVVYFIATVYASGVYLAY